MLGETVSNVKKNDGRFNEKTRASKGLHYLDKVLLNLR